ncbi:MULTISPECIES: acyl carrier protein [Streptomyces]|uniref:acyl carrier protein n=1 Tax=Streptomyces TaxID=1883 RepID=UPI0004C8B564|nr:MULTISPECIES: acyl carrier protein [Streptomyces]KOT51369.1 phosphopantetheine-binding protein [Streptomyces rimosus subsp. rimosus]
MNRQEAMTVVKESLGSVVPGADVEILGPTDKFRDALELDSIDFLGFVEALAERTGCRIDEDDYASLTTLADSADLVAGRAP